MSLPVRELRCNRLFPRFGHLMTPMIYCQRGFPLAESDARCAISTSQAVCTLPEVAVFGPGTTPAFPSAGPESSPTTASLTVASPSIQSMSKPSGAKVRLQHSRLNGQNSRLARVPVDWLLALS